MAKIDQLPPPAVINGLKGTIDFACTKGILYIRSWPRPPRLPRAAAVQAQYTTFAYISQQSTLVDPQIRDALTELALGTQRTFRDYQIDLFYNYDMAPADGSSYMSGYDLTSFSQNAFA